MVNITQTSTDVTFPDSHYVFVEKKGPFSETAQKAWSELHSYSTVIPGIRGAMALYKIDEQIYRAGFLVSEKPKEVPAGVHYEQVKGGAYKKFTVTGSYSQLPEASGYVYSQVRPGRNDWSIEHYVNDPVRTPEAELKTDILVPS